MIINWLKLCGPLRSELLETFTVQFIHELYLWTQDNGPKNSSPQKHLILDQEKHFYSDQDVYSPAQMLEA